MQKILLTQLIVIAAQMAGAQDLKFNDSTHVWFNGSLTNTYSQIGSPAVDVSVKISGATSYFISNSPKPVSKGLQLQPNFNSNAQCTTFSISFGQAVQNLQFKLYEIDRGSANATSPITYHYIDMVTVTGSSFGTNITPTIGVDSKNGNVVSGNTITGTASTTNSNNLVNFAIANSITITYCNASGTQNDPTSQSITIGDLSWNGPLPVNLIYFTADKNESGIKLDWQTDGEIGNSYFSIERSENAIDFSEIERIKGNLTSEIKHNYSFVDEKPINGNNYYRLKQVDLDGTTTYSNIIAQNYKAISNDFDALNIFPNPSKISDKTFFFNTNLNIQSIKILNELGNETNSFNDDWNSKTIVELPELNLPGMYYIKIISNDNELITKKILKY